MTRLAIGVVALCLVGTAIGMFTPKNADAEFLQRQLDLYGLFFHANEPVFDDKLLETVKSWELKDHADKFSNQTAFDLWLSLEKYDGLLPKNLPYSILERSHVFETQTLFNLLYSAKDYDTFYKTALYARTIVNEGLFVYTLSVAIVHRADTKGIRIPPIYETFPSYFFNGEIMTIAQKFNAYGKELVTDYKDRAYLWEGNVVIRWNETVWPFFNKENSLSYFTNDPALNAYYYSRSLAYPEWLNSEIVPLNKDDRGEWFWFVHKQLLTRYYFERLSNGLGEIPDLGFDFIEEGYTSGLVYQSGAPFPVRPDFWEIKQHHNVKALTAIMDFERRIREAIDSGYYINNLGEKVSISYVGAVDILGYLIQANADSPNLHYYKDFIKIWKSLLGTTFNDEHRYHHEFYTYVVPSPLENYQTALRDPAFYMIYKRVLALFNIWQQHLPIYSRKELDFPGVKIEKVEVDKLTTYFEYKYYNVTNELFMSETERKNKADDLAVLVQRPVLNHKIFTVRATVKSEVAKKVMVRFFLAPKYDSQGYEIPLHLNYVNFFQLDQFVYDLPAGETVIKRESTENVFAVKESSSYDLYLKAFNAVHGKGQFIINDGDSFEGFPGRLILPKGRPNGMPFQLYVYITEYYPSKVAYGTGFDPAISGGIASGARRYTNTPVGYPFNKPVYLHQVEGLGNIWYDDVLIYHKNTPEINVPYVE